MIVQNLRRKGSWGQGSCLLQSQQAQVPTFEQLETSVRLDALRLSRFWRTSRHLSCCSQANACPIQATVVATMFTRRIKPTLLTLSDRSADASKELSSESLSIDDLDIDTEIDQMFFCSGVHPPETSVHESQTSETRETMPAVFCSLCVESKSAAAFKCRTGVGRLNVCGMPRVFGAIYLKITCWTFKEPWSVPRSVKSSAKGHNWP